jgi:ATP-binding cassette subfamily B protein
MTQTSPADPATREPSLRDALTPYRSAILGLVVLTIAGNVLNLVIPRLVADAIDGYAVVATVPPGVARNLVLAALGVFLFSYIQGIVQIRASERVARDLRTRLMAKIAGQDHAYVQQMTPSVLLTNLTADVDAVKLFVAQAVAALISSAFLIVGASVLLVVLDWRLGLAVLGVLPIVAGTFFFVARKIRTLFTQGQEAIDALNKVINESILGAALIRLVNAQQIEFDKFVVANTRARDISLSILRLFAALIPVIIFATNMATLVILTLGGRFVIAGSMTLGEFTAFNSYLIILVFPVILIGFMSTVMAQAGASYARIARVLHAPDREAPGTLDVTLRGDIALRDVNLELGGKPVLKGVSFSARAGTLAAVIGTSAAVSQKNL